MSEKTDEPKLTSTNNRLLKKITNLVSHPFFGLFTFIAALVFSCFFFYFVELKEIKPVYSIDEINSIASQTADAPDFKIFWKDKEINNLKSVEITLWNNGKQYIDNNSISGTDPIQIEFPDGIEVLNVDLVKTSRPELNFNYTYFPSNEDRKSIIINIVGDEALEKFDGVKMKIYFTGVIEEEFVVKGRVFGSKQGFTKVKWEKINFPFFF
jgi:hypothetical protein